MSRFDDNDRFELKEDKFKKQLDEIDKNAAKNPHAAIFQKQELDRFKKAIGKNFDNPTKIGHKSGSATTQSSAAEPEIIDPEEGRKAVEGFLKLLKADHTSYKSSFLSDSVLDVIKLSKLEDAMPWLSDKEFGHHILKVENGNVYIEEELFDSFSKERQAQLEEECNKQDLQLYVNSRG